MKKTIVLCLLALAVILACNSSRQKGSILQTPAEFPADEYIINTDQDTTLVTKNGALISIPKGALQGENSTVTLEIKEAYSLEQMLKARLTTRSNGELLSSGGMIYINAKGGEKVTIKQAISVSIPSDHLDKDMQLYKGVETADGNINWTDPAPLTANRTITEIEQGKQLFMNTCASCHTIGKEVTGPDLAHFLKRFQGDKLWVRGHTLHLPVMNEDGTLTHDTSSYRSDALIADRSELWHNQALYVCNLIKIYGSVGQFFPDLDSNEINSIYRYIQNESDRKDLPLPSIAYMDTCVDSCMLYNKYASLYRQQKEDAVNKQKRLLNENGKMVEETRENFNPGMGSGNGSNPPPGDDNKVVPVTYGSVYYQFSIETFGWFNIDVLVKGKDGVEESVLFVRVVGAYREKVQVYLIVPSVKIYAPGGPAERNADEFAFEYKNGRISLPQGVTAYILAVTETESSVAFALQRFSTGLKQEFSISLRSASKEEFTQAISTISADGLKIGVKDSKNADEIRKTLQEIKNIDSSLKKIESLKPVNCNCDCFDIVEGTPVPVASTGR